MTSQKKLLGVFGGTFDPVHNGHLLPVLKAAEQTNIDKVLLIPCHIPPHKASPNVSSADRLAMTKLASKPYSLFEVSDIELRQESPSYSLKTLTYLKQQGSGDTLCFFMGMDSLLSFTQWYEWQQILTLCHLIVCKRPGSDNSLSQLPQALAKRIVQDPDALRNRTSGCIFIAESTEVDISSTQIRNSLAKRENVADLLSGEVIKYVKEHGLYQSASDKLKQQTLSQ